MYPDADPMTIKIKFIFMVLLIARFSNAGVTFDTNGVILADGSRFFPIGAYVVSWSLTPDSLISNLRQIRAAGFNTAHVGLNNGDTQVLDSAQAFGLKIIVEGADQAQVTRLKTYPALLAWTIQDEPDLNNVPPESLLTIQRGFKAWDTSHPTISCIADSTSYKAYAKIPDILAIDPYLNYYMGLPVSFVGECATKADALQKPLIVVIHAFQEGQRFPLPTVQQERSITYQAIVGGANGLNFFAFNSPPSGNWYMPDSQNFFIGVKTLVSEMNVVGPILSVSSVRRAIASPISGITATYVESGASRYIIAVSSLAKAASGVRFTVDQDIQSANILFENRSITIAGNAILDDFSAYASHTYKLMVTAGILTFHEKSIQTKTFAKSNSKFLFNASGRKLNIYGRRNDFSFFKTFEAPHNTQ